MSRFARLLGGALALGCSFGWAAGNDGPASPGAVTIDKQRCCVVVDGKPFFAIGCCNIPPEYMKECAEAGFNVTVRWGNYHPNKKFKAAVEKGEDEARRYLCDYLDAAQTAGLKVVEHPCCFTFDYLVWTDPQFSATFDRFLKDPLPRVASLVKDHPALLAYYSIDDPDLVGDSASWRRQLGQYAAVLRRQDPRHPVLVLFCGHRGSARFLARWPETYDFLGRYAYPIPYRSPFLALLPDTAAYAEIAHQSGKPFWYTPLMEIASGNRGNPLSGEMQATQVYLGVIGGASGVIWWIWPPRHVDNWRAVKRLVRELRTLTPVLTEPPLATKVIWSPWYFCNTVQARAIRHQGRTWLIAVNPTETPAQVRFKLPQAAGSKAKVWFEDRELPIADGGFNDVFAPLARHIYELDVHWPEQSPIELQVTLEALPATPSERVSVDPRRNLIPNSGFEQDTGWTFLAEKDRPPQVRGEFDSKSYHGGRRSASISHMGARHRSMWVGPEIKLNPNTAYEFGGYGRAMTIGDPYTEIGAVFYLKSAPATLDGVWRQLSSWLLSAQVAHFAPWRRQVLCLRTDDSPGGWRLRPVCGVSPHSLNEKREADRRADGRAWFDDMFLYELPSQIRTLVLNGGFEGPEVVSGWPEGWGDQVEEWNAPGHKGPAPTLNGIDRSTVYEGRASYRVVGPGRLMQFLSFVPFVKDRTYVFSAYMKADRPDMQVSAILGDYHMDLSAVIKGVSTEWKRHVVTVRAPHTPRKPFLVIDISSKQGTLWVDNVQFEEGSEPTEYHEWQPFGEPGHFAKPEPEHQ